MNGTLVILGMANSKLECAVAKLHVAVSYAEQTKQMAHASRRLKQASLHFDLLEQRNLV